MLKRVAVGFVGAMVAVTFLANAESGNPVLMQKGSVSITESEFRRLTSAILTEAQVEQLFSSQKSMRELLGDYYITKALAAEAREMGLQQNENLQFQLQYNEARLLAKSRLAKLGENQDEPMFKNLAKETYLAESGTFDVPEQVSVEHILVAVNEDRTDAQALKLAQDLKRQLEKGADFTDLAVTHSDDPSVAKNKGRLAYFPRGSMVKPFEDVAFAMTEPGQLSEPVKTQFGYHLLRFVGRTEAYTRPFEEVEAQLVEQERQKHLTRLRNEKIAALRNDEGIEVNQQAIVDFFEASQKETTKAE